MSDYLFSDVHLRPDRPDRDARLAEWVNGLSSDDRLIVVGDLCDFWMASRLSETAIADCEGLRALANFRNRGGGLRIMAGNHDLWLCPFYERVLGAEILSEPAEITIHGTRIHLVHGHLLGARKKWKSLMESRQFHRAFGLVPGPLAGMLDEILEWKNLRGLQADEQRHLNVYRQYADSLRERCDLVVIGHVHRAVDDHSADPRMIVLGGWQQRSSYLQLDPHGIHFHVFEPRLSTSSSSPAGSRDVTSSEPECTSP